MNDNVLSVFGYVKLHELYTDMILVGLEDVLYGREICIFFGETIREDSYDRLTLCVVLNVNLMLGLHD